MESLDTTPKRLSDEAQLLHEGRQLAKRAVQLSTQTHKIKVWVPILCSMILTGYYLYGLHKKQQATGMDVTQPVAAEPAVPSARGADAPVAEPPANSATPASSTAEAAPPEDPNASDSDLRKEAAQAHSAGQFRDEAKLWQQYMTRSATPQQACPAIGVAYERAGDLAASLEAFEKCVSLMPGNADLLVAFAHALQTKGDFARSGSLYQQVIAHDAKNLDARTGLALLELKQNRLREAEATALGVLHQAPNETDALLIAGIVAWRESRLPEAERMFLRGAALDEQRPDFHAFLGRIAEAERRPQDALAQYDKALALDPSDADIAGRRDRLQQAR